LNEKVPTQSGFPDLFEHTTVFISRHFRKPFLVLLNENFVFFRPLTVTGAILFKNKSEPDFHQMTDVRNFQISRQLIQKKNG
jgi:hypothetical protein